MKQVESGYNTRTTVTYAAAMVFLGKSVCRLVASTTSRINFGKISTSKCPQLRGNGRPRTWEDIIKMNFWIASCEDVWWNEVDENYVL